tara:strand:+ start:1348 stop:1995 length:648 start_codon:yes stop_codon:yes gene_type:complete
MKKIIFKAKNRIKKYFQKRYFSPVKYWEKNGGKKYYDNFHSKDGERNEKYFLNYISKHRPKKIIDIGCGYGRYLKVIKNKYPNIELVGTDISQNQIKFAKKYLSDDSIKLIVSDSTKLNFKDKYFDLALTYSLWEHIPPKMFDKTFREIKRISKKGYFLEFDRSPENKRALKIKSNHVFQYDFDSLFYKYLISKDLIEGSWGDTLYHLDFEKKDN